MATLRRIRIPLSGRLRGVLAAVLGLGALMATPALATPGDHAIYIKEAANRFCVPEEWIRAVIHRESTGNHRSTSPKGAMSLMQIMPAT